MLQRDKPKSVHFCNDAPESRTAAADDPRPRCAPAPNSGSNCSLGILSSGARQMAKRIQNRVGPSIPFLIWRFSAKHQNAPSTPNDLGQYQAFLEDQQEKINLNLPAIDEKLWRFVRERENLGAYIGRTRSSKEASWTSTVSSNRKSSNPQQCLSSQQLDDLSVMLVIGTVTGKMDDMMYGIMNHTVEAACIKTSYVEDMESDVAVLATLTSPTIGSPFESFTVKWAALEQASIVRFVVKKRDFVHMEMTGVALLPDIGERIGYHLLHSLHFPQTPELESCVRGNLSIATFCRQKPCGKNEIELCVKAVSDPVGSMVCAVSVSNMAATLTSMWRNVDCANMKKLAWLMKRSFKLSATAAGRRKDGYDEAISRQPQTGCAMCTSPTLLGGITRDAHKRKCHVCWEYVCSSCKIRKKLNHVNTLTGKLARREFPFCSACVFKTVTTSSFVIAQQEIAAAAAVTTGIGNELFRNVDSELFPTSSSDISDQF